jgi:hypothetical protein
VTNPVTGCESERTPVTVTFVPADAITITPSTTTVCENTGFTLDAASVNSGYVYTWTANPVAGSGIATSMTGSSISVTPTVGGTYVYTAAGTDGNCSATQTVTITVVAPIVDVTATPSVICAGTPVELKATTPIVGPASKTLGAGDITPSSYEGIFYHLSEVSNRSFL